MDNNVEEYVSSSRVWCDGDGAVSGHPRIYLEINTSNGFIVCPYCSKKFVLKS